MCCGCHLGKEVIAAPPSDAKIAPILIPNPKGHMIMNPKSQLARPLAGIMILALLLSLNPIVAKPAYAASPNIVISQVYGGGGNAGATYTHDFSELFNRGASPVSLAGWSV